MKLTSQSHHSSRQGLESHRLPPPVAQTISPAAAQRGVALVITLILLSVITFMAIAFLVLTRGQRLSVASSTDQSLARLAADTAQERALADLMAPMLAGTNEFNFDILVSTNFINPTGFVSGVSSPINVGFTDRNGQPLSQQDALQNLTNLLFNPRVPVIITNVARRTNDFRYYYDANRNGVFDPSGRLGVSNSVGTTLQAVIDPVTKLPVTNSFIGDPQWIGGLQFSDRNHSADNPFLFRYAYLVVPVGKSLDVNFIHNQAWNPNKSSIDTFGRDFNRNQGVGAWEINLGAFLYDLNTNIVNQWNIPNGWGGRYIYNPFINSRIEGNAFVDAGSLIKYRYANNLFTLASARTLGGTVNPFAFDGIDGYSAAIPTNILLGVDPDVRPSDITGLPWPGSDNTNHYFTHQDLLDPAKSSASFVTRLSAASTNLDSYGRYTFYRLLSQLGTDSAPEPAGRINLNYDNVTPNVVGVINPTNFMPWEPTVFFTNTANKLLADAGYKFTITNIQIYPTNYYSASVHRLLQLAANIYDSTINRPFGMANARDGFPSVFRPIFGLEGTNVYIRGYQELKDHATFISSPPPMRELTNANVQPFDMVYGIPLVIGAKKGFPNFNQLEMQTEVKVTRKLEFRKRKVSDELPYQTNQMYLLSISNSFGVEAWNSYSNAYPRDLRVIVATDMDCWITKTNGQYLWANNGPFYRRFQFGTNFIISANKWTGFYEVNRPDWFIRQSFWTPYSPETDRFWFLNEATYSLEPGRERLVVPYMANFEATVGFPVPEWVLGLKTRLRFILYDTTAGRIVDYVNLSETNTPVDLNVALSEGG
ncbi:MAG TPA: hypothetical protein VEC99_10075, partial [Clostridia bacterium]|nr:hypothetical protein [Clostridia bacterium]